MKVYLDGLEIKSVYNLNFQSNPPVASFYAYRDILPEIFKHKEGRLYLECDGVCEAKLPFNNLRTDEGTAIWNNQ